MAKKRFYQSVYGDLASRRQTESYDRKMVPSSGRAGLPSNVIMKDYQKSPYGLGSAINDTISGIDAQMKVNSPKGNGFKPKKY